MNKSAKSKPQLPTTLPSSYLDADEDAITEAFLKALNPWNRYSFWSGDVVDVKWTGLTIVRGKISGVYSALTFVITLDTPVKDIYGFTHSTITAGIYDITLVSRGEDYEAEARRRSGNDV